MRFIVLKDTQHFAIQSVLWKRMVECEDKLYELLDSMKELQELTLVLNDKVPESRVER